MIFSAIYILGSVYRNPDGRFDLYFGQPSARGRARVVAADDIKIFQNEEQVE